MSFSPVRLELGINYGTLVTYRFNTAIAVLGDGTEQRNIGWSQPLARYQIGQRDVDGATLDYLLAFFEARKGSFEGFLFRDWADYEYGGGTSKTYTVGSFSVVRPIAYPDVIGETFDVPVRFEQDEINFRFKAYRHGDGAKIFELENLTLTEIRVPSALALPPIPASLGLLDWGYDYETIGGPTFSTSTLGNNAGWENRRANWSASRGKWNIGDRTLTKTELATLISWFRVSRGAAVPWTFFDWQTEAEVDVRFGTDEISVRFDAYQSSDGQSIWSLSGIQVMAINAAPIPPQPEPEPTGSWEQNFSFVGTGTAGTTAVLYSFTFTATEAAYVPTDALIYLLEGIWRCQGSLGTFVTPDVQSPPYNEYRYNGTPGGGDFAETGPPILIGTGNSVNGTTVLTPGTPGGSLTGLAFARLRFEW